MSLLAYLATIVGVLLGFSNLPQAIKIFQRKSAQDISLTTYLIVEFGSIIWILYGWEIKNFPVIIPNVLGVFSTTIVLAGYFLYGRTKKEHKII